MPRVMPVSRKPTNNLPNISPPVPWKSARLTEPEAVPLCRAEDGATMVGASPKSVWIPYARFDIGFRIFFRRCRLLLIGTILIDEVQEVGDLEGLRQVV